MSARAVVGSIVASAAVLILGWQAGGAALNASVTPPATSTSQPLGMGTPSTTTSSPAAASGPVDGTYTGTSVNTRFGSVQVSVTVSGGTITDVTALHLTDADRRSIDISNRAAPILRDEVISAQSANVSNVGGATYTTRGYLSSVQSALDQAGF